MVLLVPVFVAQQIKQHPVEQDTRLIFLELK